MEGLSDSPRENPNEDSNAKCRQGDQEATPSSIITLTRNDSSSSNESEFNDEELKEGFYSPKSVHDAAGAGEKNDIDGKSCIIESQNESIQRSKDLSRSSKKDCRCDSCDEDDDKYKLKCNTCKHLFHYSCTGLPLYQISQFMVKGYRKFECWKCTDIPQYIQEALALQIWKRNDENRNRELAIYHTTERNDVASTCVQTDSVMTDDLEEVKKDNEVLVKTLHDTRVELSETRTELIKCKEKNAGITNQLSILQGNEEVNRGLLQVREEELDKVLAKLHAMEEHLNDADQGLIDQGELMADNKKLEKELEKRDAELTRVLDEKTKYQKERRQLSQRVTSLEKNEDGLQIKLRSQAEMIKHLRKKTTTAEAMIVENKNENSSLAEDTVKSSIDSKLEAFSCDLLTKVTQIVDQKLNALIPSSTADNDGMACADTVFAPTAPTTAWSKVVSQPQNMKSIMRDARNDEKLEESEKQRRANNIIIHGAEEVGNTPADVKKGDEEYIKEILAKIGVVAAPSVITRLGVAKAETKRPIKIVMKTHTDKEQVMKSLGRLKGTERYFGKISVKDDYTSNEREQIRILSEQATRQSEGNTEKIFKVRGNSKNGWRIVSFPRK